MAKKARKAKRRAARRGEVSTVEVEKAMADVRAAGGRLTNRPDVERLTNKELVTVLMHTVVIALGMATLVAKARGVIKANLPSLPPMRRRPRRRRTATRAKRAKKKMPVARTQ